MKKTVIVGASCFLLGSMFAGTAAFASTNYVQALFNSASITVNHADQTNGSSLVYNGTTYAQLYAVEQSLKSSGFGVTWDGHTFDIDTPQNQSGGSVTTTSTGVNITTLNPVSANMNDSSDLTTKFTDKFGNSHQGGFSIPEGGKNWDGTSPYTYADVTYNIDGKYSALTGNIVQDSNYDTTTIYTDVAELTVIGDGKVLYTSGPIFTGMTAPIPVNINLSGVKTLEIKLDSGANNGNGNMGFVDVNLT